MTGRGRPSYEPTEKNSRIVEMMAGWAIPEDRIAKVVGIDPKTLRKHHREQLDVGFARLEAQLAQNLLRIAQGHDRQALIATIFALKSRFGWVEAAPQNKDDDLGKKEARQSMAEQIASGHGSWGNRLKVRQPPKNLRQTN